MTPCLPGLLQPCHVLCQALAGKADFGAQSTSAAGKSVNYVESRGITLKVTPGQQPCVQEVRLLPAHGRAAGAGRGMAGQQAAPARMASHSWVWFCPCFPAAGKYLPRYMDGGVIFSQYLR